MKKIAILLVLTACLIPIACAENHEMADELLAKANALYAKGHYDQAVQEYRSLLDSGWESAELYYNLGNAYFKTGAHGRSVYAFEKARRLNPQDEDLAANFKFLSQKLGNPPRYSLNASQKIIYSLKSALPERVWFGGGWSFFVLALALFVWSEFASQNRTALRWTAGIIGGVWLAVLLVIYPGVPWEKRAAEGIVTATSEVPVYYSPSHEAAVAFSLPEGSLAEIIEAEPEWTLIRMGKEQSGWVDSSSIEII